MDELINAIKLGEEALSSLLDAGSSIEYAVKAAGLNLDKKYKNNPIGKKHMEIIFESHVKPSSFMLVVDRSCSIRFTEKSKYQSRIPIEDLRNSDMKNIFRRRREEGIRISGKRDQLIKRLCEYLNKWLKNVNGQITHQLSIRGVSNFDGASVYVEKTMVVCNAVVVGEFKTAAQLSSERIRAAEKSGNMIHLT